MRQLPVWSDYKSLYSWSSDCKSDETENPTKRFANPTKLSITVTCISLIISAFAVTLTDSPFSGRSPLLPCSHTVHFYIHTHLSHAHMPPESCAAEVCGGGEQTVRRPSNGRSTAVAHFSFAQNGRHHRYRRVSGYAYTDGLLPKNECHTYLTDYKHDTSDCDTYFPFGRI